jgi:hypothetical protein
MRRQPVRYMILCLLMMLMIMQPVSADDATLTRCDLNAFASAMNTIQHGGMKLRWNEIHKKFMGHICICYCYRLCW